MLKLGVLGGFEGSFEGSKGFGKVGGFLKQYGSEYKDLVAEAMNPARLYSPALAEERKHMRP